MTCEHKWESDLQSREMRLECAICHKSRRCTESEWFKNINYGNSGGRGALGDERGCVIYEEGCT